MGKKRRKKARKYARRTKIGKYYVRRRANGRFLKWTRIGKSLAADRRKSRSKGSMVSIPKRRGRGQTGDYRRKGGLF